MTDAFRRFIAERLRNLADRVHERSAPRWLGHSFTFEISEGIRFRDDGRGCRLWYLGRDDYDRAFTESDTRPPKVNWATMTLEDYGDASAGES